MLLEKIDYYFNKYPALRVLFLFDAEGEYRADFEALDMPDRRKLLYGANDFYLKVKLAGDWMNDKVVLYLPLKQPETPEERLAFPLLDLLFANKGIQPNDNIGEFMENYALQRHQRPLAEKYISFLKYRQAQEVLKPYLNPERFDEEHLIQGLFSWFLKFTGVESWEIVLVRLLALSLPAAEADFARVTKRMTEAGFADYLLNKIERLTGISISSWSVPQVKEVLERIKYNLLVQSAGEPSAADPYRHYRCGSSALADINLLHEKIGANARYSTEWLALLNSEHSGIHEEKIAEVYGPLAGYYLLTTRLKWALVGELLRLSPPAYATVLAGAERLATEKSEPLLEAVVSFLVYTYRTVAAIKEVGGYILDKADDYLRQYAAHYYKIDQGYRKAVWHYRFKVDFAEVPLALDWDAQLTFLNAEYRVFLEKLNREWLKCWSSADFKLNALLATPQFNFYQKWVEPAEQKLAVIISDALRFEAGVELMNILNSDAKNVAKTDYLLASVPSKTSVGMANLLPGKEYRFNNGAITIDGFATDTIERRAGILQKKDSGAKAVKFSDVAGKPRSENRDLFKGKVVYIYHDVIDAAGDRAVSERSTFDAVERTLEELVRFIKLLHSSYNVSKVLVTADHGFLYNDFTVEEKDKEKSNGPDAVVAHSRFEIVREAASPARGYSFPLKNTTKFEDELYVVIPEAVNRYSRSGAGNQYVHGGASLQELVVPVIESIRKREEVSGLVNPILVTEDLKVVSNVLRLVLLQQEPVSNALKERTVVVGLYKDAEAVSNEKELELNKSGEASGRKFTVDLHLISSRKLEGFYKLKVFDKADRLNPLIEADVKNQTLIQTDF